MRLGRRLKAGSFLAAGVALIRASAVLEKLKVNGDESVGVEIIRKALEAPAKTIAINCGRDGAVTVNKIRQGSGPFGFNGETGNFEDLVKAGVIDPAKVTKSALQNAASVATLLLTSNCMIAKIPEKEKAGGWRAWT